MQRPAQRNQQEWEQKKTENYYSEERKSDMRFLKDRPEILGESFPEF
jgi:hypothetical protein